MVAQAKLTSDLADSISKCLKMAPEALTRVLGAYFGTVKTTEESELAWCLQNKVVVMMELYNFYSDVFG